MVAVVTTERVDQKMRSTGSRQSLSLEGLVADDVHFGQGNMGVLTL